MVNRTRRTIGLQCFRHARCAGTGWALDKASSNSTGNAEPRSMSPRRRATRERPLSREPMTCSPLH